MWAVLADGVAIGHAGLILLSVVGAGAVLSGRFAARWPLPFWQWLYLVAAVGVSLSVILHDGCILTTLEKSLRERDRPGGAYDGSFVGHYAPGLPWWVDGSGFVALHLAAVGGTVQACRRWWRHERLNLSGECPCSRTFRTKSSNGR